MPEALPKNRTLIPSSGEEEGSRAKLGVLTISQAAQFLGISSQTLRRWDRKGILVPFRTKGGQRRYSVSNLEAFRKSERKPWSLTISQAAEKLNVHPETLRRWEREGSVQPVRTNGGQRRYSEETLENLITSKKPAPPPVASWAGASPLLPSPPLPVPQVAIPVAPATPPPPPPPSPPSYVFENVIEDSHHLRNPWAKIVAAALGIVIAILIWALLPDLTKDRLVRFFEPGPITPIVDVNDVLEYKAADDGTIFGLRAKFPLEVPGLVTQAISVLADGVFNSARFLGTVFFGDTNRYYITPEGDASFRNLFVSGTETIANLNADFLDGLDSFQFLRSDTSDRFTSGTLTFNAGTTLQVNGTFSCTDCLGSTQIQDIYLFNTGDTATGDYDFDSGTLFIDSTNNRVGIGTTTPDFRLDVSGDIRIEAANKLFFGGTGGADNDTNLYRSAADTLKTDDALVVIGLTTATGGLRTSTIDTPAGTDLALQPTTGIVKINTASQPNAFRVYENAASPTNFITLSYNSITGGGTNANILITPNGTGTTNFGGNSIVLGSIAGEPSPAANGQIFYDSSANKFKIFEDSVFKILCNKINQGCGEGGGAVLSSTTAAVEANSINSGDHAQTWNWSVTTAAKTAFTFGENIASTGSGAFILGASTAAGSTAGPLRVLSNSADSGDIVFNLNSSGDFLIQDAGSTFAAFNDDGSISFGNNTSTFVVDGTNIDVTAAGNITLAGDITLTAGGTIASTANADIILDPGTGAVKIGPAGNGKLTVGTIDPHLIINTGSVQGHLTFRTTATAGADDFVFEAAGAEKLRLTEAGNLTVTGTVSSTGTTSSTGQFLAANGTASAPSYAFTNSTGTGFFRAGIDILGISTAGSERVRIDASGNVGIGTTGSGAQLDIAAPTGVSSTFTMKGGSGSDLRLQRSDSVAQNWIVRGGSTFQVIDETAAGTPTRLTLDTSGNVGIGTTGPSGKLHLSNAVAGDLFLYLEANTADANKQMYIKSTNDALLIFGNTGQGDKVTITHLGNVGIGTTSPVAGGGLTIAPSARTSGSPTLLRLTGPADTTLANAAFNDVYLNLARTVTYTGSATAGAANITTQRAVFIDAPSYAFGSTGAQTITNASTVSIQGPPLGSTNATITNSSALRVETRALLGTTNGYGLYVDAPTGATNNYAATFATGNVGIGTTAPTFKLDVASGGATTARFGTSSADTVVIGGGTGKLTVGTLDPLYNIDGTKYATYAASMLGVKEEITGSARLKYDPEKLVYSYELRLNDQPQGSDLWVFSRIIDPDVSKTAILLTPNAFAKTWYTKDARGRKITFFSDRPVEVTYRLTAPRFDHANWPTLSQDHDVDGMTAPPAPGGQEGTEEDSIQPEEKVVSDFNVVRFFGEAIFGIGEEYFISPLGDASLRDIRARTAVLEKIEASEVILKTVVSTVSAVFEKITVKTAEITDLTAETVVSPIVTAGKVVSDQAIANSLEAKEAIIENLIIGGQTLEDFVRGIVRDEMSKISTAAVVMEPVPGTVTSDQLTVTRIEAAEGIFQSITSTVSAAFESITAKTAEIASATIQNLIAGFIKAEKIEANQVNSKQLTVDSLEVSDKTSGQGTVLAGESSAFIKNDAAGPDSKIFVSFRDPYRPAIQYWSAYEVKGEDTGFTVTLDQAVEADARFGWWIVN